MDSNVIRSLISPSNTLLLPVCFSTFTHVKAPVLKAQPSSLVCGAVITLLCGLLTEDSRNVFNWDTKVSCLLCDVTNDAGTLHAVPAA